MRTLTTLLLTSSLLGLGACQSAYYSAMEKFGVQKREILVDRVEEGREDQLEAKEQFQTTFEAFKELTGFDGGDLEDVYDKLKKEYERCEGKAEDVTDRIDSIENVAGAMFSEWDQELEEYSDPGLRRQSEDLKEDTQRSYETLIGSMKKAEGSMQPVLSAFKDRVTFLKHNLNAQAIASLAGNVLEIESDVGSLIEDMQKSIDEADSFIASMGS